MEIPDWIDQPVPEQPLNLLNDAVGKLVTMCSWLELWMTLAYGQLVDGTTPEKAHKTDISTQISTLAGLTHLLPEADRAEYDAAMYAAGEIVEMRNGILHGVSLPDVYDDPTYYQAQRRTKKGERRDVNYNREILIGAALKAWDVGGFVQAHCGRWPHFNHDPGYWPDDED